MPHKGLYSQGVAVLLGRCPSLDEVQAALRAFSVVKHIDRGSDWAFGGPGLVLAYRPEVNGYISVDVVDRPWPDSMGNPQDGDGIFGAWATGSFGPFAYPRSLDRASQQAWHWSDAARAVARHEAFVRVRSSYVFGGQRDAPVLPADYKALPELIEVTKVARALLEVSGAVAYFNPNGECLRRPSDIDEFFARHGSGGPLPQELWANVRLINLSDHPPWVLMDTVGMWQLDVPDHEACCDGEAYNLSAVANFLRNAAGYVLDNGEVIRDGDTMDGPGEIRWQGATFANGLLEPPRRVMRWFPMDGRRRPAGTQSDSTPSR
jgi:hypothetical protein